jgi:hypothetical protein
MVKALATIPGRRKSVALEELEELDEELTQIDDEL